MKIKVHDIPETGLTVSERFDPAEMNLQMPGLKFTAPLDVTAEFYRERDTVVVQVGAVGDQEILCGRCLVSFRKHYDEHYDLGYEVKDKVALDITSDIRQEILLSYPVNLVCREECKGLCPRCGANLNETSCSCPRS